MSDPTDAWFPRSSTLPATRRQKDDTHHGLPRCPLTFSLIQEDCVSALRRYTPATHPPPDELDRAPHDEWHIDWAVMGQRAPAREDDRGGLRPWRRTDFPPDDDVWMDMYAHDRDTRDPAIQGFQGG